MKLSFSKPIRRFRVKSLPFLAGLLLSPLMAMGGTSTLYNNSGIIAYYSDRYSDTVSYLQNIDATTFNNSGTWDIYTSYPQYDYALGVTTPYKTAHTLNYTNTGTMTGSVGWEFDYGPLPPGSPPLPYGGRSMSASFLNDYNATIQAVDGTILNPPNNQSPSLVSYLWIFATNIVNNGTLIGDGGGEIRLTGVNVDLFQGTLEIGAFARGGSSNGSSNYTAAIAIYDEYWQQTNVFPNGTPYTMDSSGIWNGVNASSPTFYVNMPCGMSNYPTYISFIPSLTDSVDIGANYTNVFYTNSAGSITVMRYPTRVFKQAVFVGISDPDITGAIRFLDTGSTTNLFREVHVRLTSPLGETLYLVDTLASSTNRGLLLNQNTGRGSDPVNPCTGPRYRPANYLFGGTDNQFAFGAPGAGTPANNFLYDENGTDFTNFIVQATYAGYSAYVDNLLFNPSSSALTNQSGRIVIDATNLDLSWMTITNLGSEVAVHAGNLIDSEGAVVVCQNLSYNLGSAVGNLNVTNLVAGIVPIPSLFNGTVDAFSALWTNGYPVVIPNYDTNGNPAFFTNFVEVDLHVLLMDATGLSSTAPETVQDLILHSTNMVVSDSMNVVSTLLFDGQILTLQGTLDLSGNLQNWNSATAPILSYFTNNGVLSIPQDAHFGDNGPAYTTNITPAIAATGTLSEVAGTNMAANDLVIVGTNYTFVQTIANSVPNQVKIAATFDGTMSNLIAAINHAAGSGTSYSTNTPANPLVTAGPLVNHAFVVTANTAGASGNIIITITSSTNLTWNCGGCCELSGGADVVTNVVVVLAGPYDAFVNNGAIGVGGGVTIDSGYFQSGGIISAPGGFSVTTSTGLVENASISSGQYVDFSAGVLELDNSTITAGRQLNFNVTNSLYDTGGPSGNTLTCNQGFNLPLKPTNAASGDLLGTTIFCTVPGPNKQVINNTWAGTNYGVSTAGYTNNTAVGRLFLDAGANNNSSFKFTGVGASNALYVDYLELRGALTNGINNSYEFSPWLSINTNLVIYYAQAIVSGVSVAEKIDAASKNGKNGGRLRWVPAYAGPWSSTYIVYPDGKTYGPFNAALAASTDIDSDGDGTVNAYDPTPFFVSSEMYFTMSITNTPPPSTAVLTWDTIPLATNYVLYTTNLITWQELTNFVSPTLYPSPVTNVTVFDTISNMNRFYRVRIDPWLTYPY